MNEVLLPIRAWMVLLAVLAMAVVMSRSGSVAQAADSCPNAALRAQQGAQDLAGCRAYEMVSPPGKNSISIDVRTTVQARADGDAVAYSAPGAFAGAATSLIGGYYLGHRVASGWTVDPVDAPQSNGSEQIATPSLYFSTDMSKVVQFSEAALTAGAVAGGGNLYLRDNQSGSRTLLVAADNGKRLANRLAPFTLRNTLGASGDLTHFAFVSELALAPDAAPGVNNVYEAVDGQVRLVNRLPDGSVDPSGAQMYAELKTSRPMSEDGRRIVFQSPDIFGAGSLYMRVDGTTTIPISVSKRPGDPSTPQPATFFTASADGNHVFFTSATPLTVDAGTGDLYRYDVDTDHLENLTGTGDPTVVTRVQSVSADGEYIYFTSKSDLTGAGVGGQSSIYLAHAGQVKLVAPLTAFEYGGPSAAAISPGGRYLAYASPASVTGADTTDPTCTFSVFYVNPPGSCVEVYRYDAQTSETVCLSCTTVDGANRFGDIGFQAASVSQYVPRTVLDDGRVLFNSDARLLSGDVNGRRDVYQWHDGVTTLVSSGRSNEDSMFADASADGRDVFFFTSERLVAQDTDDEIDLYDARANGGIDGQNVSAATAKPCVEDACQAAPSTHREAAISGSLTFRRDDDAPDTTRPTAWKLTVGKLGTLKGTRAALKVKAPGKGGLRVSGPGVLTSSKLAGKAGTYMVPVRLSPSAQRTLRRKHRVTVRVSVRFAPAAGKPQVVQLAISFRTAPAAKKGRS